MLNDLLMVCFLLMLMNQNERDERMMTTMISLLLLTVIHRQFSPDQLWLMEHLR